jgi:hypothetical protein
MRTEQVLSMGDRRRSSPHGGAPPAVRLPGVKSLSTGSSVHGLQHREGEMGGVKKSSGKGVAETRCRRMDKVAGWIRTGASEAIGCPTASISERKIQLISILLTRKKLTCEGSRPIRECATPATRRARSFWSTNFAVAAHHFCCLAHQLRATVHKLA